MLSLEGMKKTISDLLEKEIEIRKEEIIKEAMERTTEEIKKMIRNVVGGVAIKVSDYYSVERMGPDLVIRVRIEGEKSVSQVLAKEM